MSYRLHRASSESHKARREGSERGVDREVGWRGTRMCC